MSTGELFGNSRIHLVAQIDSTESAAPSVSGFTRVVYLLLAGGFFFLAVLGIVLPGLPATPFLLLTSCFLLKAWPRLNDALLRSRCFGAILRDWQEHRGISRSTRSRAIGVIGVTVLTSCYFSQLSLTLLSLIVTLALVGVLIIFRLPLVTGDLTEVRASEHMS